MAGSDPVVALVGMKALRRDINRLADDPKSLLYDGIKAAGLAAAKPVAEAARAALPVSDRPESGSHQPGRLRGDVRVSATRTGATVRMGRAAVPWAGWVEFGGTRKNDGSHREFVRDGRYLFPAARGLAARSAETYTAALTKVFADAAAWSNTGTSPGTVRD